MNLNDINYLLNGSPVGGIFHQGLLVLGRPAGKVSIVLLMLILEWFLPLYPNQLLVRFFDVPLLNHLMKLTASAQATYLDNFASIVFPSAFSPDQVHRANLVNFVPCLNFNYSTVKYQNLLVQELTFGSIAMTFVAVFFGLVLFLAFPTFFFWWVDFLAFPEGFSVTFFLLELLSSSFSLVSESDSISNLYYCSTPYYEKI